MKKNSIQKIGAVTLGAAIVGLTLGAGAGYTVFSPNPIVVEKNITVEVPVEVPVVEYVNVTKEVFVEKEVPVEVIKEVVVTDTELIQATCDRLLFEDLAECQKEVKSEDKAIDLAWAYLLEQLNDESFVEDELKDAGLIADEDEFSIVKIYDDFEDIEVVTSNYDRDSYEFALKVKVNDEEAEVKKYLIFNIEVEDGVADFVEVVEEV